MRNQTPPLAPSEQASTVHIVLDDFGHLGHAYRETDEGATDETSIVENFINGEYTRPVRVVAFNVDQGWAHDVTNEIATRLLELSADRVLSASARDFVERVTGRDVTVADSFAISTAVSTED